MPTAEATKKIPVGLRIDKDIKLVGERRAALDRRTFTAYIEWLIQEDCRSRPEAPTQKMSMR
jgi:hypothetical protein